METVELRVHGVHGTSPGAMLGVADGEVGQVAGDRLTGIYRTKDGTVPYRDLEAQQRQRRGLLVGRTDLGRAGVPRLGTRALWLILLPFALVNLAYWARIGLAQGTGQSRWGARAVRVSGLLLTVFFVVTPCVVAIDMGAWQCFRYGVPGCTALPDWLNFLAGWAPGQRIALATLLPVAVVTVLWLLSKTSIKRYEVRRRARRRADDRPVRGRALARRRAPAPAPVGRQPPHPAPPAVPPRRRARHGRSRSPASTSCVAGRGRLAVWSLAVPGPRAARWPSPCWPSPSSPCAPTTPTTSSGALEEGGPTPLDLLGQRLTPRVDQRRGLDRAAAPTSSTCSCC